jgi:hypothetical protein
MTKTPALNKPETSDEVAGKFLRTLDKFQALEPSFKDRYSNDDISGEDLYPLAPLRPEMATWVAAHAARDDYVQDASMGYALYTNSGFEPHPAPSAKRAFFGLVGGSEFVNHYSFEVGSHVAPPDPSFVTFPLYKAVLLTLISIWPAPWAHAQCAIWGQDPPALPGEPPFPYSGYQMPWISYLCAERAAKVVVPREVAIEHTPDGGLLMIATEERFDPTNVDHMRPSRLMAEIMIEHGGDPSW